MCEHFSTKLFILIAKKEERSQVKVKPPALTTLRMSIHASKQKPLLPLVHIFTSGPLIIVSLQATFAVLINIEFFVELHHVTIYLFIH